jgi:predicted HicB family RNase H-like nuclease
MLVDMDADKGREPRKDDSNKFRVQLRVSKKIPMYALAAYLDKKTGFNTEVLEAISKSLACIC